MFLDCVATFTCVELCTYKQFMFYTLLTSLIALDRNDLRKKVSVYHFYLCRCGMPSLLVEDLRSPPCVHASVIVH